MAQVTSQRGPTPALHAEFTRSIAVIGPDGIDAFLEGNPFDLLNNE